MKRILVADDSVTIQKVIALTFADEPFEVQSVGTGAEALELVKSWKPDIVLADVIMPQMNGYELCRAVKQLDATNPTPVLLLAGTFEAFDEEEAKSVGANDFITKPFESGELIEKVKALIGDVAVAPPPEVPPTGVEAPPPPAPPAPAFTAEAPSQTEAPASVGQTSEPDIWDILSDSGDYGQPPGAQGESGGAGFGPIDGTGVVDVGSFDVGIGRPESTPPAAPEAPALPQTETPPAAPQPGDQPRDLADHSRVENMERDFFGFDTGAVEEIPEADAPGDAVEEVTFEMEEQTTEVQPDAQEVSFVVPEPAPDKGYVTGETISPELLAPEPPPPPVFDSTPSVESPVQPAPEPPLELPVDLAQDLPEGFSPEPAIEEEPQVPVTLAPEPVAETAQTPVFEVPSAEPPPSEPPSTEPAVKPSTADPGLPDDATIRKVVEEKVEKIVWEVVPEMAEAMIREAIQKIKDGS